MKRAARALLCVALALSGSALWATTAIKQSDTEMIRSSQVILTGHCLRLESAWVDRVLVTKATIAVDEVLKGSAGQEVTVVLPGGVDLNRKIPIAMTYPGAPQILVREQVLLFLTADGLLPDALSIVGFAQGKYTLVKTSESGWVGTQSLSDLKLQKNSQVARGGANSVDLGQLRQKIREVEAAEKLQ